MRRSQEAGGGSRTAALMLTLHLASCAAGPVTATKIQGAVPTPIDVTVKKSHRITDCGELDVRITERATPAGRSTVVPASIIMLSEEKLAAKERETRSRFACFLSALAECRPARLTVVNGRSRATRTVVPLKDGSCAMRLESIEPRRMGLTNGLPYEDFKTYSTVPAVKLCTFVSLDLWNNQLDCDDEVVESEVGREFQPVSTEDCPVEIKSQSRPTQREKACMVDAILSCNWFKAHFRVPSAYGGENEMVLSISPRLLGLGRDRKCKVDLKSIISLGENTRETTYCGDISRFSIALSSSWNEDHLFLLSSARNCRRIFRGNSL